MTIYFFNSIRKTILAVCKQFTNIQIERRDKDNTLLKTITTEMYYMNKAKSYIELNSNKTTQGVTLPMISVYNTSSNYNIDRQQNNLASIIQVDKDNNDILRSIGTPTPSCTNGMKSNL